MNIRYIICCGVLLCAGIILGVAQKFYREKDSSRAMKFGFYGVLLITLTILYYNMTN